MPLSTVSLEITWTAFLCHISSLSPLMAPFTFDSLLRTPILISSVWVLCRKKLNLKNKTNFFKEWLTSLERACSKVFTFLAVHCTSYGQWSTQSFHHSPGDCVCDQEPVCSHVRPDSLRDQHPGEHKQQLPHLHGHRRGPGSTGEDRVSGHRHIVCSQLLQAGPGWSSVHQRKSQNWCGSHLCGNTSKLACI